MKLIVGLGNPGKEYEKTRHNIGFMSLDYIGLKYNLNFSNQKFDGIYAETIISNEKIIFLKPQKYINLSGDVMKKYIDYFKIPVENVLIICDDMNLEAGKSKIRYKGGSAGHNGLKNIESNLKTNEYKRIKIGISKNKNISMPDYVLGKIPTDEFSKIMEVIKIMTNIIEDYLEISFDNLMNKYNK